jgi:hypothetical protein
MVKASLQAIGLIIRAGPYQQRSARSQLDVALVAAALELPLSLYFLGQSVLQLLDKRELDLASLPAGYRGWASLTEMTEVQSFAEPDWVQRMHDLGLAPVIPYEPMSAQQMRSHWQSCERIIVL